MVANVHDQNQQGSVLAMMLEQLCRHEAGGAVMRTQVLWTCTHRYDMEIVGPHGPDFNVGVPAVAPGARWPMGLPCTKHGQARGGPVCARRCRKLHEFKMLLPFSLSQCIAGVHCD